MGIERSGQVEHLVVGAGISGLAFANEVKGRVLVVEREAEAGGYCRTVHKDGFTWDYSGHFFHFQRPDIDAWMRARMPKDAVRTIVKRTRVRPAPDSPAREVEFPFQTNIHQLPRDEMTRCLADLRLAELRTGGAASSFKEMLARKYGDAICEMFLVPYNEKLYATDLDRLDVDAMGRFFPHPKKSALEDALDAMAGSASSSSYNATFTYPVGGAQEYVRALLMDLPASAVSLGETVERIDVDARVAHTNKRAIPFEKLITSAPLPSVLKACGVLHDESAFTSNQVLVFNLGFDAKGRDDVHWMYFADPSLSFYRVGFYDNILGANRMSLYVELGMPAGAPLDVDAARALVMNDLQRAGVVTTQKLVAHHHVLMRPAYVHVTKRSIAETARTRELLAGHGVFPIGRYGGWMYCSIEDDIVEARALAAALR
jgi:protoporphyrinogen oxidase